MDDPGTVSAAPSTRLIITADDYGYAPPYDEGIAEAALAGALDAVSAMVLRGPDLEPLAESGVEVGLHLELEGWAGGELAGVRRATAAERDVAVAELERQLERFAAAFGRAPSHLDGHRHCHAAPGLAAAVGRIAAERGMAVRSVSSRHRRTLRCLGVATADRLVGRLTEAQPALPEEIRRLREDGKPRAGASTRAGLSSRTGVYEWMTHPGRPGGPSAYDRGRAEDLALLLELGDRQAWRRRGIVRVGPSSLARTDRRASS